MSGTFVRLALTAALAAAGTLGLALPASAQSTMVAAMPTSVSVMQQLLSTYRTQNRLPGLAASSPLGTAASGYARFLAQTDQQGHTADGRNPGTRIAATGYRACYWSENVFIQWSTSPMSQDQVARTAFNWWRGSAGHNANMLSARARDIGISFYSARNGNRYIYKAVQNFGSSRC
jgi:uncharacterized protein YkwD